jgi:hypothetical protein
VNLANMYPYTTAWRAVKRGRSPTGKLSYWARLIEKKTSAASLSLSRGAVAYWYSAISSWSRSLYHAGGEWRGRPSSLCHWRRSLLPVLRDMVALKAGNCLSVECDAQRANPITWIPVGCELCISGLRNGMQVNAKSRGQFTYQYTSA